MTLEHFVKTQHLYQIIRRVATVIALVSLVVLFFGHPWLLIVIVFCIGIYMYLQDKYDKMAYTFKNNYLKTSIESKYPHIRYDMNKGFTPPEVYGSRLIERGDIFKSEDMLSGKINQTRFRTADVKIQFERPSRSSGRPQIVTRFSGKYYEIELPFIVKSPIYIVNNGAEKFGIKQGLERVDFEYIDFNNEVDVYSNNKLEAFKLLKPKAMEAVLSLRKKYGSIAIAFFNKTMVVAMEGRNSFEFYIHRRIDKHLMDSIQKEIQTLSDLAIAMKD